MQRFPSYFDAFAVYICWNFGYTRAHVDRPSATKIREIFICPFCLPIPFSSLQANRIECLRPALTTQIKYAAKCRWNRRDVVARISTPSRPPTPNPPSAPRCYPSCSLSVTITGTAGIERRTCPPPRIRPRIRKIRCDRIDMGTHASRQPSYFLSSGFDNSNESKETDTFKTRIARRRTTVGR